MCVYVCVCYCATHTHAVRGTIFEPIVCIQVELLLVLLTSTNFLYSLPPSLSLSLCHRLGSFSPSWDDIRIACYFLLYFHIIFTTTTKQTFFAHYFLHFIYYISSFMFIYLRKFRVFLTLVVCVVCASSSRHATTKLWFLKRTKYTRMQDTHTHAHNSWQFSQI